MTRQMRWMLMTVMWQRWQHLGDPPLTLGDIVTTSHTVPSNNQVPIFSTILSMLAGAFSNGIDWRGGYIISGTAVTGLCSVVCVRVCLLHPPHNTVTILLDYHCQRPPTTHTHRCLPSCPQVWHSPQHVHKATANNRSPCACNPIQAASTEWLTTLLILQQWLSPCQSIQNTQTSYAL